MVSGERIEVASFLMHFRAHLDEIGARFFLRMHGGRFYSGIRHAKAEFCGDPNTVKAEAELAKGRLCVGIGGGIYDEHNTGEQTCCARLVTEHLGVYGKHEATTVLVDAICRADRTNLVSPYELPSLIKGWHRLAPPKEVIGWGDSWLEDLWRHMSGDRRYGSVTFTMQQLVAEARYKYASLIKTTPSLRKLFHHLEHMRFEKASLLSFANFVRIQQELYPVESHGTLVKARALLHIDHMVQLAVQFQMAYDEHEPNFGEFFVEGYSAPLYCDIQRTDNPDVAKVARTKVHEDEDGTKKIAAVVIIQNSRGNIQVITNTMRFPTLDLSRAVSEIRRRELFKRRIRPQHDVADIWYWESSETISDVPWWYYLKNGQLILNGSDQSSQNVPPTALTIQEVYYSIIEHARYDPSLVANKPSGTSSAA